MKDQLIFDTTDANTIADSDSVGAFLRAAGGDLITSQTEGSNEHLHVAGFLTDDAGNKVSVTSNALDVNIASGSISVTESDNYAEDSAHTTGDTGGFVLAVRQDTLAASTDADGDYAAFKVNDVGSLYTHDTDANTTLSSIDTALAGTLDINIASTAIALDVNLQDGSGTDITSTGGALDVNIASGSIDEALANTAISNESNTIGATAESLVASALSNRKYLWAYNNDNRRIYLGGSGVTTADGFPMAPRSYMELRIGASVDVQAISASGTADVRILQAS